MRARVLHVEHEPRWHDITACMAQNGTTAKRRHNSTKARRRRCCDATQRTHAGRHTMTAHKRPFHQRFVPCWACLQGRAFILVGAVTVVPPLSTSGESVRGRSSSSCPVPPCRRPIVPSIVVPSICAVIVPPFCQHRLVPSCRRDVDSCCVSHLVVLVYRVACSWCLRLPGD